MISIVSWSTDLLNLRILVAIQLPKTSKASFCSAARQAFSMLHKTFISSVSITSWRLLFSVHFNLFFFFFFGVVWFQSTLRQRTWFKFVSICMSTNLADIFGVLKTIIILFIRKLTSIFFHLLFSSQRLFDKQQIPLRCYFLIFAIVYIYRVS